MTETGWLIESSNAAVWWTGTCWTTNSEMAIRFSRKIDGEKAGVAFGLKEFWVGEHSWTEVDL